MRNLKLPTCLALLSLSLVACQKAGDSQNVVAAVNNSQSAMTIDCSGYSQDQISGASLAGPEVTAKNKAALYSLAGAPQCGSYQKTLTFTNPGTFLVTANLKSSTKLQQLSTVTQVLGNSLDITGPKLGLQGFVLSFALANPENIPLTSVAWNFGDGSLGASGSSVTVTYDVPGTFEVTALAQFQDGSSSSISRQVTVLPLEDQYLCVRNFNVVAPATGVAGTAINMGVFLPTCLQGQVTHVEWGFGDGGSSLGLSTSHTYLDAGSYNIVVSIFHPGTDQLWFNFPLNIVIAASPVVVVPPPPPVVVVPPPPPVVVVPPPPVVVVPPPPPVVVVPPPPPVVVVPPPPPVVVVPPPPPVVVVPPPPVEKVPDYWNGVSFMLMSSMVDYSVCGMSSQIMGFSPVQNVMLDNVIRQCTDFPGYPNILSSSDNFQRKSDYVALGGGAVCTSTVGVGSAVIGTDALGAPVTSSTFYVCNCSGAMGSGTVNVGRPELCPW